MAVRSRGRWICQALGGVGMVALLAACGGSEVFAVLQIVTPLGGTWTAQGSGETLGFTDAEGEDKLYEPSLPVEVAVSAAVPACGPGTTLSGTLNNGALKLFPTAPASTTACMSGQFTDLRRLELSATGEATPRVYLNDRVAVNLQAGIWRPDSVGGPVLKFTAPSSVDNNATAAVTGCDVTDASAKVAFTGTLTGFNTTTLERPKIAALVGTALTAVEILDGASLSLRNAAGHTVTLHRQRDTTTSCS